MTNKLISTYTPSSTNRHRWQTYVIMPPWHTHERKLMTTLLQASKTKSWHPTRLRNTTQQSKVIHHTHSSAQTTFVTYTLSKGQRGMTGFTENTHHRTTNTTFVHTITQQHLSSKARGETVQNWRRKTSENKTVKCNDKKGCLYISQHTINTSCTFTHGQHITHTHDHIHPTSMIPDNERIHQHRKRDAKSTIESTPSNKHTSLQATQVIIWTQQEHVLWFNRTWTRWYQISTKSSKRPAFVPISKSHLRFELEGMC